MPSLLSASSTLLFFPVFLSSLGCTASSSELEVDELDLTCRSAGGASSHGFGATCFTFTRIFRKSSPGLGSFSSGAIALKGSSTSRPLQTSFMMSTMISCCSKHAWISRLTITGRSLTRSAESRSLLSVRRKKLTLSQTRLRGWPYTRRGTGLPWSRCIRAAPAAPLSSPSRLTSTASVTLESRPSAVGGRARLLGSDARASGMRTLRVCGLGSGGVYPLHHDPLPRLPSEPWARRPRRRSRYTCSRGVRPKSPPGGST